LTPQPLVSYPTRRSSDLPAGRVQDLAATLEEHQDRALGGARPDGGAAADLRARGRDPQVRAAGVLDHRGRPREGRPGIPGPAARSEEHTPELQSPYDLVC